MHRDPLPLLCLPTDLSDETAAKLLYDIARALENHYATQINRYYHPDDDRQPDLWDGQNPPF